MGQRDSLGIHGLWNHGGVLGRWVTPLGQRFFSFTPPAELQGLGSFFSIESNGKRGWYWERTNCCLFYQIDGHAKCADCSLTPADERRAAYEAEPVRVTNSSPGQPRQGKALEWRWMLEQSMRQRAGLNAHWGKARPRVPIDCRMCGRQARHGPSARGASSAAARRRRLEGLVSER